MGGAQEQEEPWNYSHILEMLDNGSFDALVENDDLPGIKERLSRVKEHESLFQERVPTRDLRVPECLQLMASCAARLGRRDIVLFFIAEMRVRVNAALTTIRGDGGFVTFKNARNTPLMAAALNRHENLALQLLVIPDQEDFDLDRIIPATVFLLMIAAGNGMVRLVR